jgi:glycosyltransferase involved in cell wall biosynthesis
LNLEPMKVFLACRPNAFQLVGGDTVQLLRIKERLSRLGFEITIAPELEAGTRFDIIHLFNLFDLDSTYIQGLKARALGVPVLLTPNYWDPLLYFYYTSPALGQRVLKSILPFPWAFKLYKSYKNRKSKVEQARQKELLELATLILPNSKAEKELLKQNFVVAEDKFKVIYNAVEGDIKAEAQNFIARHRIKDFILCVGRIEERKNQLNLIKALQGVDIPLVFIGGCPPYQQNYLKACRKAALKLKQVVFLEYLEQQQIFEAMAAAKVHILPSWWENTGLANLEAALCGCNIVSTVNAPVQEYFKDWAWICDPADLSSIRQAVLDAYAQPWTSELKDYILSNFNWETIAGELAKAYQAALRQ